MISILNKRKKITIILISIFIVVAILLASLSNKNGYKEYSASGSFGTLLDLLLKSSSGEDTIKLDEEKINSLGASYLQQGIKKGNVTILGLNVHIDGDYASLLIPVKYKSLPIMLSTKGKLEINESNMVFYPEYFKAGSVSVPKGKVFSVIKDFFGNKIEIGDNSLVLNKKLFSNKIEIIQIKDGSLIAKINDGTKKIIDKADKAIKAIEAKDKEKLQGNNNNNNNNKSSGENNGSGSNSKPSQNIKGLTSKESQMVSIINSTIATLESNPSYNYWSNVNQVMGIYETLSPTEKSSFKSKVYSYVDVARAKRVKSNIK